MRGFTTRRPVPDQDGARRRHKGSRAEQPQSSTQKSSGPPELPKPKQIGGRATDEGDARVHAHRHGQSAEERPQQPLTPIGIKHRRHSIGARAHEKGDQQKPQSPAQRPSSYSAFSKPKAPEKRAQALHAVAEADQKAQALGHSAR